MWTALLAVRAQSGFEGHMLKTCLGERLDRVAIRRRGGKHGQEKTKIDSSEQVRPCVILMGCRVKG